MNFTYENQGTHTYLVYQIDGNDTVDAMSLGMLTNNKISGLAQALFTQMNAVKYIKYDVSAKISVKQFLSGQVNKKRLLGVFNGIVDAMFSAEDYMINVNTILLDLNYIYADVSTCETVLICLPIENIVSDEVDLRTFFKNIMFSTQFDPNENCDHIAKIINYLNSAPIFSLEELRNVLNSIEDTVSKQSMEQPKQPTVPQESLQQQGVQSVQQQVVQPTSQVQKKQVQAPVHMPAPPVNNQPKAAPVQSQNTVHVQQQTAQQEKQISFFTLLMHYNSENKALYKAQKAAKKSKQCDTTTQAPTPTVNKQVQMGFAIPGQQTSIQQSVTPVTAKPPVVQPVQVQSNQTPVQSSVSQTYTPRQMPQGQSANFGETTVLGGGAIGETTVLTAEQNPHQQVIPNLLRKKTNEKIILNKPVFRIGKERSYVDYFIGDNTAISRSHANVITREGEFFVVDTNSKNHTFVNGNIIQSNIEMSIKAGDIIRLANEDFEFNIS